MALGEKGTGQTRVGFYTLGCKVNQAETDNLRDQFSDAGFLPVPFDDQADVYVVNTCSVTHVGDAKSRQILRQARRRNPKALVVATGCYVSIVRDALPVEGVLIVRNRDKDRLLSIVGEHVHARSTGSPAMPEKSDLPEFGAGSSVRNSRPMVKVQDGCNGICAYCIIPRARGHSRSVPREVVIEQVQHLAANGHAEIVLTGVDLGSYGEDLGPDIDLGSLIHSVLTATDVSRLRISSLEPGDFDLSWLTLWKSGRLAHHLHIPLQAGHDSVLARMRRRYTTEQFSRVLDHCRREVPGIAITTDVIAGFPGETEEQFEASLAFIQACAFDGMHVFPYSRRPGTGAAHLDDTVAEPAKKVRAQRLGAISRRMKAAHIEAATGDVSQVAWESVGNGVWRGLTSHNIRVYSDSPGRMRSNLELCTLTTPFADGCWAEPIRFEGDLAAHSSWTAGLTPTTGNQ